MFHSVLILAGASVAQAPADSAPKTYAEIIRSAQEHAALGEVDIARAELDATELSARGFEWAHVSLAVELARASDAGPGLTLRGRGANTTPSARVGAVSKLYGCSATCRALAVSPSGERVAAGGAEHEVHVWNARTGDPERLLAGHSGAIVGLAFSKDGRRLVSGSADGSAIIWGAADGHALLTFRAGGEALTAIAWSANNDWLATADKSLSVRVWNATNSDAKFVVRGHTKPITGLAFSPDGKYLASTSEDGNVRVVDVKSGDLAHMFTGNDVACNAVVFEPDSLKLRVTTNGGSLRRLDLVSGTRIDASFPVSVPYWCMAQSTDAQRFATGSEAGIVRVFDSASKPVFSMEVAHYPIFAAAFDARTSRLFFGGEERVIYVLETDAAVASTLQRATPGALPEFDVAAGMKPLAVDLLCRRVVERPGLDVGMYAQAENLARATVARAPTLGEIHTTVGASVYRQDRFEEALETLNLAGTLKRGWPPNLAFRAMTLAKLGRLDEAHSMIERLDTLLLEKRWEADVEMRALLAEARAVAASAKPAPK